MPSLLARPLFALVPALCLWAGGWLPATAAPEQVDFPAAANIRPIPVQVGPELNAEGSGLLPNDVVVYDAGFSNPSGGGAILNFSVRNNNTAGTETILASSSVDSGTAFGPGLQGGGSYVSVSPNGFIYHTAVRNVGGTNYQDIVRVDPVTLVRTIASSGSDSSLGPIPYAIACQTWDFSTGTIIYCDSSPTFQGAAAGFYRTDPATGKRSAVSLNGGSPGSGVAFIAPTYPVVDTLGNIFYLEDQSNTVFHYRVVVEIPVTAAGSATYGARKIISSNTVGSQAGGTYQDLIGLALDISVAQSVSGGLPTADSLIVVDQGTTQANAALYRLPVDTAAKTKLISFNSTNANTGTAVFDLPSSAVADTTGRIYYGEFHSGTGDYLTAIPAGTHAAAYLTAAQNLSNNPYPFVAVPAPTPTLAAATASNAFASTATLNGNVTADGGVANTGIIARGFVYALTATNPTPRIGGVGVTPVSNFFTTTLPVAQNTNLGAFSSNLSGLSPGVSYTFSAYALDASGYTYTAPVSFATASTPTVTSPTAANITGVSATLGGNVTADSGATITARGIVYSPTATNATPVLSGTGVVNLPDASATTGVFTDGTGNNLANGTAYSYRAYATNAVGTSYSATATFTTAAKPTATAQSVTTAFNTAKAITLTGTDPNTPAQTLTYTVATAPTHGTLSGTAPNLTYTPTANYQGPDSFTFTVSNGQKTSTAATVSITVTPGTPTATAQAVNVNLNLPKAIPLAGTDPDVPALPLTYTVVTAPTNGTLSGTAPNLTYTPSTGFSGADSFTFTVSNGTNTSSATTVSLTVIGQPTITSFTPASGPVGTVVTITGTNLQNATGVTFFRNVAGTTFTVVSSTQVTVKVPTGAGSGSNSSSTKFTVTP